MFKVFYVLFISLSFCVLHAQSSILEIDTLLGDRQVNDDESEYAQYIPDIAVADNGSHIIVWQDQRHGHFDIYAQRYDSTGAAIGGNILINDDKGERDQLYPSVAMADDGAFVIAWTDDRNGHYDVYAQRFDAAGNIIGANILVNDDDTQRSQKYPSVAMADDGTFVIAWHDDRSGVFSYKIYAQRFTAAGNKAGSNILVTDYWTNNHEFASVGMANDGSFVIAWEDFRSGNYNIYTQRFDSAGSAIGNNVLINDDNSIKEQKKPSLTMSDDGACVIAWEDMRDGKWAIYGQRFDASGNALGANIPLSGVEENIDKFKPSVAMSEDGSFVVSWTEKENYNGYQILYQRFDASGTMLGAKTPVEDMYYSRNSRIGISGNKTLTLTWHGHASQDETWFNVYAVSDDLSGESGNEIHQVSYDGRNSDQFEADIDLADETSGYIAWADSRKGNWDIYVQKIDMSDNISDANILINDDRQDSPQHSPSLAAAEDGSCVITWLDMRNDAGDIYLQRLDASGDAVEGNIPVNDDSAGVFQHSPAIAMAGNGAYAVTWTDARNGDTDIYIQRFDAAANAVGTNMPVSNDSGSGDQFFSDIAMSDDGSHMIAWLDTRSGNTDVFAQRFDASGDTVGTNILINDIGNACDLTSPAVAMAGDASCIVVWTDQRNGNNDIYVQRLDSAANAVGSNILVNDNSDNSEQLYPAADMSDDGSFLITWLDNRNGKWDVYAQLFGPDGNMLGNNFPVNNSYSGNQTLASMPAVCLSGNKIVTSWNEKRFEEKGHDIYYNVLEYSIVTSLKPLLADSPVLHHNYPNPFNPETRIRYRLSGNSNVRLSIYDVKGRKIATLINDHQSAGDYSIRWNASGLGSGIYFYRLETDNFNDTKKMMLMK